MKWMLAAIVALALVVPSLAKAGSAEWKIHKGATGLTWLTNPEHQRFGTPRSRAKAQRVTQRILFEGLAQAGFLQGALCVHGYEGSWQDPNAPFWGGMQMDYGFQESYGPVYMARWGTADHWPVWAQLHAAYQGWRDRGGWGSWPNTARYCGLI